MNNPKLVFHVLPLNFAIDGKFFIFDIVNLNMENKKAEFSML